MMPRAPPIDDGGKLGISSATVIYRRFGRTNLALPVFSLGGMRYQESWTRGATTGADSQKNLEATLDRALELGITHVETARGYGTSEAQLGPALARHRRDRFVLQSKVRPSPDVKEFEQQLEESFQLLKIDYLDLFAIHGVNDKASVDWSLAPGGCLEVVERWRKQGRIRYIGFSTHAPQPLILRMIESGRFDYVNLHCYYLFQDNLPILAAARRHDMGTFIISPSDKGGRLYRPSARLLALCEPLSPMVFNDLWCLSQPDIHTLSLGAARPTDFDEHLKTLPLLADPASVLEPIANRLEAAYRQAVGDEFARRWSEGLREWNELPGKINVRRILWLRNLVVAYDLLAFAQERYMAMSPDDIWVPGARAAEFNDAEMIAALPESPFREQIPGILREAHKLLFNPKVRPQP
jgi:predicted aldo/keto reductase-like oxidoreductase